MEHEKYAQVAPTDKNHPSTFQKEDNLGKVQLSIIQDDTTIVINQTEA